MASKTGMFLKPKERESLIKELKNKGELSTDAAAIGDAVAAPSTTTNNNTNNLSASEEENPLPEAGSFGTGCLTCGEDDDHANLLLCEACNDEYHTYCLDPPLRSVPTGDWFCGESSPVQSSRVAFASTVGYLEHWTTLRVGILDTAAIHPMPVVAF